MAGSNVPCHFINESLLELHPVWRLPVANYILSCLMDRHLLGHFFKSMFLLDHNAVF